MRYLREALDSATRIPVFPAGIDRHHYRQRHIAPPVLNRYFRLWSGLFRPRRLAVLGYGAQQVEGHASSFHNKIVLMKFRTGFYFPLKIVY
jgi:hypothetical protein